MKSSDHSGGGEFAAVYICPMGFGPSPMAAAAAWWAAASERGVPSDVTVTFSSSRRFRQAALGFRFLSGHKKNKNHSSSDDFYNFLLYGRGLVPLNKKNSEFFSKFLLTPKKSDFF